MPSMKRPAAAAAAKATTPMKKARVVDPLAQQKELISYAVSKAPTFPKEVLNMLMTSLETSVFVKGSARHPYQQEVADMVKQVLEAFLKETEGEPLTSAKAKVAAQEAEKKTAEEAVEKAKEALEVKKSEAEAQISAAKEAKQNWSAASKKHHEAQKAEKVGLKEMSTLADKKAALDVVIDEHFAKLVDKTAGEPKKSMKEVTKALKQHGAEKQLLEAISAALQPEKEHGGFEKVVIETAMEILTKARANFAGKVEASEATKAALAAAVESAEAEAKDLQGVSTALEAKAAEAKDAKNEAEASLADVEKTLELVEKTFEDAKSEEAQALGEVANAKEALEALVAIETAVEASETLAADAAEEAVLPTAGEA
mmetsp:Transcript_57522/g.122355  ORF Transcript_57522/g.122355 Transcript_57522/m.122355 type:complete len:371 (-) Transcript_57522:238-1350(-)|eukprot:CAMPEP_0206455022 /NCGR_PEP_ID=MMETSP0324_2-20121206/21500_1 /ASSEMBLY_ACC=CAM_ASM_000836 /TAXON_ID=2866 /ORGANISM="Crypthecodinium cohnii, Strain Seligo" /LENGTH=370 /DNA_ID=CAMNT_0053925637 /DNA_START=192 /DNA_END=1304 /DNA_ORIENTATION=-